MWKEDNEKRGKIRIRCNTLSGILDSNQPNLKTKRSKTFRAILRAIKKNLLLLKNRGLIISLSHIKGHQDDEGNFQNLSRWDQLNVIADHKAKKRLAEFFLQGIEVKSSTYHGEGWSCWLGGKKYKDFAKHKLQRWIFTRRAREYWSRKNKITY